MVQNEHLFFQLAAALIPVLLLGGAVTATLHPATQSWADRKALGYVTLALVLLGVVGELFAVELAFVDEPDPLKAVVVVWAVTAGTTAAGAALLAPWVKSLTPSLYGRPALAVVGVVIVLGAASLSADVHQAMLITEVEKSRQDRRDAERLFEQQDRNLREAAEIERALGRLLASKRLTPRQEIELQYWRQRQAIVSDRAMRQRKDFLETLRERPVER